MPDLESYLTTIQPDLDNIVRLFGFSEASGCICRLSLENGRLFCAVRWRDRDAQLSVPWPNDSADERLTELHRKRAARRLCRQTLYRLCRELTGIHPPWGSLTGVRPTHLLYEALGEDCTLSEAEQQVIRRFDVTPEKASLLAETVRTQRLLPPPEDSAMDVYIGIPFCTTRCTYCSFSSGELGKGKLVEPYLQALFHEMEACSELLRASGHRLRAVYVGGGTPTSLNEDQFDRFLHKMMSAFPDAVEYTVEAGRPDTITRRKLETIRDLGVTRISINPQTMNDRTLRVIGRNHTAAMVEEAYALAREVGIGHINMDVIAGLPGETVPDFTHTMDAALRLHPESLTVHTLAIKRSSRLHLESYPLPEGDEVSRMVDLGRQTAHQLGLTAYYLYRQKQMAGNLENVGYALLGHACLYNVDIMEENSHILALGAGGISKRIFPEEGHIGREPNVSNIEQYIARIDEMIARKRRLWEPEP